MPEALRVLFVIKGLGMGGAEMWMLSATRWLCHAGHSVDVVNLNPGRSELEDSFEATGARVCRCPVFSFRVLSALWQLAGIVRRGGYSLIHAHLPWAGVLMRGFGRLWSVPVVYSEHSLVSKYHWLTRIFNGLSYRYNSAVVAVSQRVAESIDVAMGAEWRRYGVVIPNCLDLAQVDMIVAAIRPHELRQEFGINAECFLIGTVAALRPVKRIDLLINAMSIVHEVLPSARVLIVGSGPDELQLRRLVRERALDDVVLFAGLRHDAIACMTIFDCYVLCSDWEGLPLALLEAMAVARPIIATDVGGVPELIKHGVNGKLIPAGDLEALTAAICSMHGDLEVARKFGTAARYDLEMRDDFDQAMRGLIGLYQKVRIVHDDVAGFD